MMCASLFGCLTAKPARQVSPGSLIISDESTLVSVVKHFGPNMLMHIFFCSQNKVLIKVQFVFFCGTF